VHKAVLRTAEGEQVVAVKIMRPGVRERFSRDIQAMRAAARLFERHWPDARRLRMQEVVETLARSVAMEMDLRLESAALSELAENTREDPDFRVPRPFWDLTCPGRAYHRMDRRHSPQRSRGIEGAGHDRVALAAT
jgi:ubiquinone biosynthesis protein